MESLNNCISELQQKAFAQRLELEDSIPRIRWISTRTSATTKEELVVKEKAIRDTQIRSMHEMGGNEESSRITGWRILFTEVERKSWNHTEAHFTSTRVARKNELFEWLWRIPRSRVELEWTSFTRSQSTSRDSKSALYAMLSATNACHLTHGIYLDFRKTFFANPRSTLESSQTPYRGIISSRHQVLQVRFPCSQAQGHL